MESPKDVVGRVAAVLRVIAGAEPGGVSTTAAAREADLARPTVHRLLAAMREQGLVDRSAQGLWLLGPDLFLLGLGAAPRYDTRTLADPIIRRLAVTTGESASFSVRRGAETVCLRHEEGTYPLRSHVLHEGVRFPLGVASAGLAILAFLPEAERRHYLDHSDLTAQWGQAHARATLTERLEQTRASGYAVNPGLVTEGSWGMAAAVFDHAGNPTGALSLTGVEARFGDERVATLGVQLLHAALELSRLIQQRLPRGQQRESPRSASP